MPPGAVSPSELEVMKVLWKSSPQTAAQVVALLKDHGWSESTIKTLLSRLVKKGFLAAVAEKNRFSYSPLVDEATFGFDRGSELAKAFTGGPAFPVMLQFLQTSTLTPAQIDELKRVLEDKTHD